MNCITPTYYQTTSNSTFDGTFVGFTSSGKERDEETGYSYFGARYYDAEILTGWLSVDPMADKYLSISPYAYCAWNPVKLVDLNGKDWYRNDEIGDVIWKKSSDISIDIDGVFYRNIGTSYKQYKDGVIYSYGNSPDNPEVKEIPKDQQQFYKEGGQFIPSTFYTDDGTKVNVTFLYKSATGGNGDKSLDSKMVSGLINAVNTVNKGSQKITSLNVSTTTTGQHSSSRSSHYLSNGAKGLDIDIINGIRVEDSKSGSLVDQLQLGFKSLGIQNFGPRVNKRPGHDNHIHANVL